MSKRDYRLGKRAEQMEETRQQILDAGRELLAREGFHEISVSEIAERASVTRATVYNHFDSKTGVLLALLEELERRAEIHRLADALQQPDPVQALREFLCDHCRFWAADVLMFRNVFSLSAFDPELKEAKNRKDRDRKASIAKLIRRLATAGRLHPAVTKSQAIDAIWLLTHFETFDFLYRPAGRKVDEVAGILVTMSNSLIRDRARREGESAS